MQMISVLALVFWILSGVSATAEEVWHVERKFDEWALACRAHEGGKECLVAQTFVVDEQPAKWLQLVWRMSNGGVRLTLEIPKPNRKLHRLSDTAFGGLAMRLDRKWGAVNLTEEMCDAGRCTIPLGYSPTELLDLVGQGDFALIVPSPVVRDEAIHFSISSRGMADACAALVANLK